tara:strand:- start:755 stop:1093 length:339 start_codon:yes stop_codon:yes gene_type:complete
MEQSQIDIKEPIGTTETTKLKEEYPDTDETNIIQTIIKLMEQIEDFVDMSGLEKKIHVLSEIKMILGNEVYNRYYYFITQFIDFTVGMTNNKIKINLNKYKKSYCCFKYSKK